MNSKGIVLFIFILIVGCTEKKPKFDYIDQELIDLSLSNYSFNFFQFDRMRHYDRDTLETSRNQILRLKKRVIDNNRPIVNLSIVIDWKYNQSHVLVEPNSLIENQNKFEILWRDPEGVRGIILFEDGNKKKHLEFAAQVYDQIMRDCEFYLKTPNEYIPILDDIKSRKAFHITMLDYYGLLGIL